MRINVCGTSGSGKSTLARALAETIGAPYIELDALHHKPNWQTASDEEFLALVEAATRGEEWVIDGNYRKARPLFWDRLELLIWLDYSLPTILGRLSRRTFRRAWTREVLWHGNREVLWKHLLVPKDSLFWWVLTTYRRRRRQMYADLAEPGNAHIERVRLRSPREADEFLAAFRSKHGS